MVILNFRSFLTEQEGVAAKGNPADAIMARSVFLGIEPELIPQVMQEPQLMVNKVNKNQQIAIAPFDVKIKCRNNRCKQADFVGADINIKPKDMQPYKYTYINNSLNYNRDKNSSGSINRTTLDKLINTGLEPQ